MKQILLFLTFFTTFLTFSQSTIYYEDFTGENGKGAVTTSMGIQNDLTGVDWSIDYTGAELQYATLDYFAVTNEIGGDERFRGKALGITTASGANFDLGTAIWYSPSIDITSYTGVAFSLNIYETGNLNATEYIRVQYRIDGGTWTTATTNGIMYGNFTSAETNQTGLSGSSLEFKIIMANRGSNHAHSIDNIVVSGTFGGTCSPGSAIPGYSYINNFSLNEIDNSTGGSSYTDYTSISSDVNQASSYEFSLTITNSSPATLHGYAIYIDYNNDGDYNSVDELVYSYLPTTALPSGSTISGFIIIPTDAVEASIPMRVMMSSSGIPGPCDTSFIGEVEDYTLNILAPIIYVYNNGWSPLSPVGESTQFNDIIIANGTATFDDDTVFNSLTVNPSGNLFVDFGWVLTPTESVTLESTSTQYSSLLLNGEISGTVNYIRHVNSNSNGNDLVSAPLSGSTFLELATANSNIYENLSNPTDKLFGPFDKTTGTYLTYDTSVTSEANAILNAGEGYRAASSDGSGFIFTGTPTNSAVSIPITVGGPYYKPWNLIGNPYPSYLDMSAFLTANISQFAPTAAGIYAYDGDASDGWQVYNLANSTGINMTPGQGFMVASKPGGGTVNFTPDTRTTGTNDDFISGRTSNDNDNWAMIKLEANSGNLHYETSLYFLENNVSNGLDLGYDTSVFGGNANGFSIYSKLVENNEITNDFAIQSLSYDVINTNVEIPLGINVDQGQQTSISIMTMDIPENTDVYLEDRLNNTWTLLNSSEFVFTPSEDISGTGRFYLRFSNQALSINDLAKDGIKIYALDEYLHIEGALKEDSEVSIYDNLGRLIKTNQLKNSTDNKYIIDISSLSTGIYIIKLNNNFQQKNQKVIVN